MLQRAIEIAINDHKGQYRKYDRGGVKLPYFCHPIEVMKMVWKWGVGDEEVLAAAALHDVVEDSDRTVDQIEKEFSKRTAKIVEELTLKGIKDREAYFKAKAVYMDSFKDKMIESVICKMADRICNTRDKLLVGRDAVSYYKKADSLMNVFHERFEEIKKRWGFQTAQNISYEKTMLEDELGL